MKPSCSLVSAYYFSQFFAQVCGELILFYIFNQSLTLQDVSFYSVWFMATLASTHHQSTSNTWATKFHSGNDTRMLHSLARVLRLTKGFWCDHILFVSSLPAIVAPCTFSRRCIVSLTAPWSTVGNRHCGLTAFVLVKSRLPHCLLIFF